MRRGGRRRKRDDRRGTERSLHIMSDLDFDAFERLVASLFQLLGARGVNVVESELLDAGTGVEEESRNLEVNETSTN